MEIVLLVFVGVLSIGQGARVYNADKQNTIFCRYPLAVKDVKEYNHFCGALMIGFGIAAEFTLLGMIYAKGILRLLFLVLLIVEAVGLMKIYNKNEKRFRR